METLTFLVHKNQDDCACPTKISSHLCYIFPPDQKYIFSHFETPSQIKIRDSEHHPAYPEWKADPNNVYGLNVGGKMVNMIAYLCGYKKLERYTSHGARMSGATTLVNSNQNLEYRQKLILMLQY